MSETVTILGAGIVGICSALSLLERGQRVRLIDRGDPGQETSLGNAGVVSPWSIIPQSTPGLWRSIPGMILSRNKPLSVRAGTWPRMIPWGLRLLAQGTEARTRRAAEAMDHLCAPSIDLYHRHLAGTGHEGLIRDSHYIHAFRDEAAARDAFDSLGYRIRAEKGAPMEVIDHAALKRMEPAIGPAYRAAITIGAQARCTNPGRMGQVLAQKARSMGAEIIRDEVQALTETETGWHITGQAQSYDAAQVVIAMGAWSAALLRPLGYRLPLMAERGYHIECENPGVSLENSIMDMDGKFVASSMEGGVRIAGQAEFGPAEAPPDPRRKGILARQAREVFPDLNVAQARFWMGRRPSFPDSLPVLGPSGRHKGLYFCFGHSHYGLMMAPKSGEVLADHLTGTRPNLPLAAYSASRF
ncbi:FAD-dependent oxidoreductase [Roseovarius sp. A21]|uniref:FAD-dependent oxidoreductase n=1 Tax=Roseovarius bejariae TaxID=2576383 RepID=A0A844CRF7_9RHOB|nr:FAD-dependent oxidoreductase [Roseovarius bejariae]MRU14579.1 FAD-dependent oxidoreductase [Roseovarius bejariae]